MIKVAVAGAAGRMGTRISALSIDDSEIMLSGAFEREGHEFAGRDIGEIAGLEKCGVLLSQSIEEIIKEADVVIDFTTVESTLYNIRVCAENKTSIVIGTTGLSESMIEEIKGYAATIPIVFAPNMSVGVNLLLKVIRDVASTLGDDYDIEIVEAHHKHKKDAPSGTAMKMAHVAADAVNRNLGDVAVYARKGMIGERKSKEIGIQTIRAGDIVGEHTVMFCGTGERIELTHKVSSRDTFSKGALRAAIWLKNKAPGLYDMQDVLGLKD